MSRGVKPSHNSCRRRGPSRDARCCSDENDNDVGDSGNPCCRCRGDDETTATACCCCQILLLLLFAVVVVVVVYP